MESPDLNPIEHCWVRLKETLMDNDPNLRLYPPSVSHLPEVMMEAISRNYFDYSVESMPDE